MSPPATQYFRDQGRKMLAHGYRIIPIAPGGKWPVAGLTGWPSMQLGPDDLARWPGAGVGVITGCGPNPIVGIDIDAEDERLSEQFKAWCFANLGPALVRVGLAPKTLLVYRASEAGWGKGASASYYDLMGTKNRLEVLCEGQQFVAYHTHPDTRRPYKWIGEGVADRAAVSLTTITLEQAEDAIRAFNAMAEALEMSADAPGKALVVQAPTERTPRGDEDFFGRVNDAAMQRLVSWVPDLLPTAREYQGGYRVTQVDLGRSYEEDLSILPEGIKDWGVHDQGDAKQGSRTPIDLVLEWAHLTMDDLAIMGPFEAAMWLCEQLGTPREQLGYGLRKRREREAGNDAMRAALAGLKKQVEDAEDMISVRTTVIPGIKSLLLEFPLLETEAHAIVQAKAKSLSSSIPKAEFHRLVRPDQTPTVRTAKPLTEFGNTERMLERFGDGLMYVPDIGTWYIWNGNHWRKSLGGRAEIEHFAKETVRALANEAGDHESNQQEFYQFCALSQRAQMVANMVKLAESDPRVVVPASELDKYGHFLGVKNGVVDLRDGRLMPPDPSMRITLTAGCAYDPAARAPLFEQTVSEVFFGDTGMVEYVLRTFGYALLGNPKEDIMFIAFGNGANGKSTVFNAVREAFGGYARSADAGSFVSDSQQGGAGGAREDLVRLRGARFVYVNEPDENGELREGAVKSMTGGDAITARGLYSRDSVEITPTWVVYMPTNHKPIIKGNDNGIWRRMGMLPFERNFEADQTLPKDRNRREKLRGELPGILALLVRAAMRYAQSGLTPPTKVTEARDSYRSQMDLLSEWLDECCEVGNGYEATAKELWESWEMFARQRGMLYFIKSSTSLSRRLDARFPPKRGTGGVRMRNGLRIRISTDLF